MNNTYIPSKKVHGMWESKKKVSRLKKQRSYGDKIVKVVFFNKLKYTGKPLSKERKHNTTEKMVTKQNNKLKRFSHRERVPRTVHKLHHKGSLGLECMWP